ncbi:hypothetical protein RND81_11G208700 [Saponaria officinalis]|uniref:AAA+ ATPase domain-containing protein n=1 Tax=Saponaria officinalis TaxID=3572 RepID=A0AAW1HQ26_SAPOF
MTTTMNNIFSTASLFTFYASLTAILSLFRQFYTQFVPDIVRHYIASKINQVFSNRSPKSSFTLVVNENDHNYDMAKNLLYAACKAYLTTKLRSTATCLTGSIMNLDEPISYGIAQGEEFVETLEKDGIKIVWKFVCRNAQGKEDENGHRKSFELCFDIAFKTEVLDVHIPLVVVKYYQEMNKTKKKINLYSKDSRGPSWNSVQFSHPFTFDALALEPTFKQCIIDDLDKFIERKEFYKKVGKAWKRGYLLYGPPGTGKSSLIAAMANYLKYDIYDIQLSRVHDDAVLRRLMLSTQSKSILVIEDIDCATGLSRDYSNDNAFDFENDESDDEYGCRGSRVASKDTSNTDSKLSLSGVLNFIDGLWSCCADERIIILTTNRKEKLDKALLRPGRMDMHIHMSYLTMNAFKILVNKYLCVTEEHSLFKEIERLLETVNVTPAQVAEELLRSDNVDVALSNVVDMLKKRLNRLERLKNKGNDKSRKSLKGHELNKDEGAEKMPDTCGDISE